MAVVQLGLDAGAAADTDDIVGVQHIHESTDRNRAGRRGNQASIGSFTIGYDAENRQISATSTTPSLQAAYTYDGTGQRVMEAITGGATPVYVHDAFGNLAAEYTLGTPLTTPCTTCHVS